MATWPLPTAPMRAVDIPRTTSSPTNRTVTASATPHSVGGFSEILASTSGPVIGFTVHIYGTATATTVTSMLMNIAVGATGVERIILPNLQVGNAPGTRLLGTGPFWIPLRIPANTRVSAQIQAAVVSDNATIAMDFYGGEGIVGSSEGFGTCTDYGTNLATSLGTPVTTSATANVKGSWTPIVASTTAPIRRLMLGIQNNGVADVVTSLITVDVGLGPSPETLIFPDWFVDAQTGGDEFRLSYRCLPMGFNIPVGSRLSLRASRSVAAAVSYDFIIHGIG